MNISDTAVRYDGSAESFKRVGKPGAVLLNTLTAGYCGNSHVTDKTV